MAKSVLVAFTTGLFEKNEEWWRQFSVVVAPKGLESAVRERGLPFIELESMIDAGSVQGAEEITHSLSTLTTEDGERISKLVSWRGYELWWMHYDSLMYRFCLPYTQHRRLLEYLKDFDFIHLYRPPHTELFRYYLSAYQRSYRIYGDLWSNPFPPGLLLQAALSVPFLLWLGVRRPKMMVWTSDQFDSSGEHDFRMRYIYKELRDGKKTFVEFIRSMEPSTTVLRHALRRGRPVIYSYAITQLVRSVSALFDTERMDLPAGDPQRAFLFLLAAHGLKGARGDIWAIVVMRWILGFIGVRSAIIPAASSRNFPEVLACKISGIPTVGILHGVSSKFYNVYDFMPEFTGEKSFALDSYGVWSQWWKEYFLKNGKVYGPGHLHVSGLMRPLSAVQPIANAVTRSGPVRALFVSEQLGAPREVLPYLVALLEAENIELHITFRSYKDGFEQWLKKNRPDILNKILPARIHRVGITDAIAQCDTVIGSHSTSVLEALLQYKSPVLFNTGKWGDYFELASFQVGNTFFARTPEELVEFVLKSKTVSREILEKLRERFFGNPYQNGSAWVVHEAERLLSERQRQITDV